MTGSALRLGTEVPALDTVLKIFSEQLLGKCWIILCVLLSVFFSNEIDFPNKNELVILIGRQ